MPCKRRVLVVVDSRYASASAIKRGLAYRSLFDSDPNWAVEYVDRNPRCRLPPVAISEESISSFGRLASRVARKVSRTIKPRDTAASRDDVILQRAARCDAVYVVKVPAFDLLMRLRALDGPRVLMDLNDAVWLPHARNGDWERLEEMLSLSHAVICENQFVAEYGKKYSSHVFVVPDCCQLDVFDAARRLVARDPNRVRIGWIGSAATASALYSIWEPLEAICTRHPDVELRILGAGPEHVPRFDNVRWSSVLHYNQDQMVRDALAMDIGIYPLFHVTESIARGNGKAVLYMAAGAATISERLDENERLVNDGVNGLLAYGHAEWFAKLEWLVQNADHRQRIGEAGLQTVREQLSDRATFASLINALNATIEYSGERNVN